MRTETVPMVSVILVNYNGESFIGDCLDSLKVIDYPEDKHEVIVVDNASKDNSVKLLKEKFRWVKLIESNRNTGFSEGNNMGVKEAKGKYIVFLNSDTVVEKNFLTELVKKMESDSNIGACSSQVLYLNKKYIINTIGGFWSILGIPGSTGEGMRRDTFEDGTPTFSPTGCSMMVRADVYRKIGGFDNDYFLYCEDADIGWRMWNQDMKIISAPKSIVYHRVTASLKGLGKKKYSEWYYFYSARNRFYTIMKNARTIDLIWMLPLYYASHITLSLLFLITKKFTAAKATMKGVLYHFTNFNWIKKRRMYKKAGNANVHMLGLAETFKTFMSKRGKHFS